MDDIKEEFTKGIIVNRVSSSKQNPVLQRKDCLEFAERKKIKVIKIFEEIASAGKSKQKAIYEAEAMAIKEHACIILWKFDRGFRNKRDFANFMLKMYELHNIKVYSVREEWVSMLWDVIENFDFSQIPYPYNESVQDQLKSSWKLIVKIIGKVAEDEILDKGARVRNAVRKTTGKRTLSYKGNIWGRKRLSKKVINQIVELRLQGKSIREISREVIYYDKNNHPKNVSVAGVHKILTENQDIKSSQKPMLINLRNNEQEVKQ